MKVNIIKASNTDMTEGAIGRKILQFAIPLFIGNLFQQLYNTADSLIVGNFIGHQGLAAISATSNLIFLLVGFMNGLSMGASVVIARQFGAKQHKEMSKTIHTLIAFGLIMSCFLTIFGVAFSSRILELMNTPQSVISDAISYFQIYFAGVIGLVMYNVFASILQAIGNSKHPLYYLTLSSVTNVILDIVFIRAFGWGVWSAALATILSQILSAVLCFIQLLSTNQSYRISIKNIRIERTSWYEIVKYGLPSGLQNSIIGFSNVIIQSQINTFGAVVIAGCGAYQKIEGFGLLPITSLSLALTTYIGQNAGAEKHRRVKDGSKFGLICCMVLAQVIGIIAFLSAPVLIAAFVNNNQVIEIGTAFTRTVTLFYFLPACSHSIAAILRGKGKPLLSMSIILICWCIIRVLFLITTLHFIHNVQVVFWAYPLTWGLSSLAFIICNYRKSRFMA
jgi:putative MATE family efflux protein